MSGEEVSTTTPEGLTDGQAQGVDPEARTESAGAAEDAGEAAVAGAVEQVPVESDESGRDTDMERAHAEAVAGEHFVGGYSHRGSAEKMQMHAEEMQTLAADYQEQADALAERPELSEEDRRKLKGLQADVEHANFRANNYTRIAEKHLRAANDVEGEAVKVYDARQTVDHELEPLSPKETVNSVSFQEGHKIAFENLEKAQAEFKKARELEDKLESAEQAALRLEGDLRGLETGTDDEGLIQATTEYVDKLKIKKLEVREEAKTLAYTVFRKEDELKAWESVRTEHYQKNEAAYYDSALKDMTDSGIPFEANNPKKD